MKRFFFLLASVLLIAGCEKPETPTPTKRTGCQFEYTVNGLTVTFKNTSTDDLMINHWEFGDNTQSADVNPTHTYSKAGSYTVTLVAYGGNPNTKWTCTQVVTVSGGGQQQDPEDDLKAYAVGFILYKLPYQTAHYKIECEFNALVGSNVTIRTADMRIKQSDLPFTYTLSTQKYLCDKKDFNVRYSAIFLDLLYNSLGDGYEYNLLYDWEEDIWGTETEYILQSETGNTKIGVLIDYRK